VREGPQRALLVTPAAEVAEVEPVQSFVKRCDAATVSPIGPSRKEVAIQAKQTVRLRETARARSKQTGRKKKPRPKT
jgi:hypothetical protein